jgi:uncharacterized protein (TIRG00374 family)
MAFSYQMLRKWGFATEQVAIALAATGVWNVFANVLFAVAAVGWLALGHESHAALTTAAVIGTAGLGAAIALFAVGLHDESNARLVGGIAERAASWARRLVRRPPVSGWGDRLVGFRAVAVGLIARRWLPLTLATLAGHLTVFGVLLVSVRAVGITAAQVSAAEVFASWALIRIITTIPVTPGGVGIVELGLTGALVTFGGPQVEVVSAVLLYRFLTYVPPIAIGGVCLLVWQRLPQKDASETSAVASPPP